MELLLLGALLVVGLLVVLCGAIALAVQAVLWVIFLPFRVLGAVLFFPLWIAGLAVKAVFSVLILPVLAIGALLMGGVVLLLGAFALMAPLLILGLLFVIVVMIVKALTAAPVAA